MTEYTEKEKREIQAQYLMELAARMNWLAAGHIRSNLCNYWTTFKPDEARAYVEALRSKEGGESLFFRYDEDGTKHSMLDEIAALFPNKEYAMNVEGSATKPIEFVIGHEGSTVLYVCVRAHHIPWKAASIAFHVEEALKRIGMDYGCDEANRAEASTGSALLRWSEYAFRFWWD